jgi:hypothetical protein
MPDIQIEPHHLALLALLIITVVMLRLTVQRFRKNAEKKRRHEEAIQAAKTAERKQRMQSSIQKAKVTPPKTRIPLADPFATPFTGNIQGIAAKWEAEVHQIGRQIIGQIDSKMAALQAITLDANRTANRLEVLVEHLEHIARQQIEWQQNQMMRNAESEESAPVVNVIPATESPPLKTAPLADVLKELANDLEGIHKTIKQSTVFDVQPEPVTILRFEDVQIQQPPTAEPSSSLRGEVEMLSNYGLASEEIARRLNISLAEVNLILQVQQNQW